MRRITATTLLLPAFVVTMGLVIYPLYVVFEISLRDLRFSEILRFYEHGHRSLEVFRELFADPAFWRAARRSLVYTLVVSSTALILGLFLALALNRRFPGRGIARVLVLLPWPVPASTAALIWLWIFQTDFGVLNHYLHSLGLIERPIAWLSTPNSAFFAVMLVTIWKVYPFYTLMMLAGLQAIPGELYESAQLDGAGDFGVFRNITLPALLPVMGLATILQSLWVFSHVDIIKVMTDGGPFGETQTIPVKLYLEAFQYSNLSYAAALGVVMFLASIVFIALILPRMSREFY